MIRNWIFGLAALTASIGAAAGPVSQIIFAPGGKIVFSLRSEPNGQQSIVESSTNGSDGRIILRSKESNDPKENLTFLSNLTLSPNAKTLYFEAQAWATSGAVHSVDVTSSVVHYVVSGSLLCVIYSGLFEGDLVVEQHRYYVEGGSYQSVGLFKPDGVKVGNVKYSDRDQVCPRSALQ